MDASKGYSGICLKGSHGVRPWREKESKKADWYSRIASSNVKSSPSQQVLRGWPGNARQNSNTKIKYT